MRERSLVLSMLGPFRVDLDGLPVTAFKSNKVRALLAYLAAESGRPHPRKKLAGLLWPERPDAVALSGLRDALSNLRWLLQDREAVSPLIWADQGALQFNTDRDCWLDVAAFSQSVAAPGSLDGLELAVALYRGDFLEGFSLGHNPAFEDWLLLKQEQFKRQMTVALCRLADLYAMRADYALAEERIRRWLALDPLDEEAQRQLMRALALQGKRNSALAHYEAYRYLLADELGVEPDANTAALYQHLRDGTMPQARDEPEEGSSPAPATP